MTPLSGGQVFRLLMIIPAERSVLLLISKNWALKYAERITKGLSVT